MLWAYFGFSQYLIIWAGNLPKEIAWYQHRLQTGWRAVGILLVLFHFAVPFQVLLSRRLKRHASTLARIAAAILVARVVDLIWLVANRQLNAANLVAIVAAEFDKSRLAALRSE